MHSNYLSKSQRTGYQGLDWKKIWVRTETCRRGSLVNTVMKLLIPLKEGNVQQGRQAFKLD
jgi:hypothetical protein